MSGPLLETKLHLPRLRPAVVPRPRLSARLGCSRESVLTVISAPAGFGKTTLLTEWSSGSSSEDGPIAWLALDPRDNAPSTFWTYLLAALHTVSPDIGAAARLLLQPPGQAPIEVVLESLLNDLHAFERDVVLVLDDYHLIEALEVHEAMAFFLDHLPRQAHVVIATRADPPLPLARLRARGDLVEIRAADLRFTTDEAATYLQDAMGLTLSSHDVEALDVRTEGWIAALQLAALSMQGRDDVAEFIAGFAGDDRYIVDYLAEEVLQRQSTQVRQFLLDTSLLSRLTGSLCDAVTGAEGGKATLQALDRDNLFVVPLDDRRRWYRYHHLFADVLRARLLDEQPGRASELHLRASDWYERHGDLGEAIHHAMAGEAFSRAADLVERALPTMQRDRQEAVLRQWFEALPDELVQARPLLGIGYVGALMSHGELEGVEALLQAVERCLDVTPNTPDPQLRSLPAIIAMYRAGQARILGDVAGTITHARRALDLAGDDDHLVRGAAAGLLGLAHWSLGDLEAAHRRYAESVACLEDAGHLPNVLGCTIALADLGVARGLLSEAIDAYQRALEAAERAPTVPRGTADMHVGIGALLIERNQLDAAVQHLRASEDLGEHTGLPQNRYRWRVAMALVQQVQGDAAAALQLLDEAERVYNTDYSPDVRPIAALRARVWLAHGRTSDALGWARARRLSVDDELSYLSEFEHVTLARILLAQLTDGLASAAPDLEGFLERLLRAAEEGGRAGSVIEVLMLQALAEHARGHSVAALAALRRAVVMAEPEGYVRAFVEHGAPMAALLTVVATRTTAAGYVGRLLAAFETPRPAAPSQGGLVVPLSGRELEVLTLLATALDGPDIARELVVSVNTMRTHTKNIYAKLGVNSRRAAVHRAQQLDLLSRTGHR